MLTRCRAVDRKRGLVRHETPAVLEWLADDDALAGSEEARPVELSITAENRLLIAAAVEELDPNLREPIELTFFDGLTQRDAAETLGLPLGTVKTRIRAAMDRLRHALKACRND